MDEGLASLIKCQVEQSLLVTGFGYEHDDAWATNIDLFKEFTDISRGVRRLGAAAVDMSHVALGIVEAYWEYCLKPWDMAAGILLLFHLCNLMCVPPFYGDLLRMAMATLEKRLPLQQVVGELSQGLVALSAYLPIRFNSTTRIHK
ncbi:hypothetical protein L1049_009191 [Liquidambar formosana]|uniref:Inositol-phosphate phosphatase n=1 Tax=Liquidambar formosana TaxID=63359 RepID=A0AAP0X8S2_LIQFO